MADMHELETSARRAYELGRLRSSLWVMPVVGLLWVVSWACCGPDLAIFVMGPALLITSVGLLWKGMAWATAVLPGILAGALAFTVPVVAEAVSCSWLQCVAACGLGGMIATGGLIAFASFTRMLTAPFLAASVFLTWLCGSLGCAVVSWTGVLALAAGLLVVVGAALPWLLPRE